MSKQQNDEELNTSLKNLDSRIKEARRDFIDPTRATNEKDSETGNALALALRVGVELLSAVAVGTMIGLALDYWLDTKPWFMLGFIFLGGGAGMLNVYRMARGMGYADSYQQQDEGKDSDVDADDQRK